MTALTYIVTQGQRETARFSSLPAAIDYAMGRAEARVWYRNKNRPPIYDSASCLIDVTHATKLALDQLYAWREERRAHTVVQQSPSPVAPEEPEHGQEHKETP